MNARKKILLVDGSRTSLLLERMILGPEPYELLVALDGEEALTVAAAERPDLILMDVVLPGLDGLEALRRLRAARETHSTPVILVTTRAEPGSVEEGWEAGCNDYIAKPIDAEELISKVRSCLGA
jgi:PleD family two-component response regulator